MTVIAAIFVQSCQPELNVLLSQSHALLAKDECTVGGHSKAKRQLGAIDAGRKDEEEEEGERDRGGVELWSQAQLREDEVGPDEAFVKQSTTLRLQKLPAS